VLDREIADRPSPAGRALAGALCLGAALAQSPGYPARTIRLVAAPPPAASPTISRAWSAEPHRPAERRSWSRDKAGATGNLAIEHVAKSAPDGYTLLLVAAETS